MSADIAMPPGIALLRRSNMEAIWLNKSELYDKLKELTGYSGTKIRVSVSDVPRTLRSYWDNGSRTGFSCYDMEGELIAIDVQTAPEPFGKSVPPYIPSPDKFLVEHVTYNGKDLGLHIYLHPQHFLVKMLPIEKPEISKNELFVLVTICSLKSFARADEYREAGFKTAEIDKIKEILFQRGFINKAGAITPSGRNVVATAFDSHCDRQSWKWNFKKESVIDITKEA